MNYVYKEGGGEKKGIKKDCKAGRIETRIKYRRKPTWVLAAIKAFVTALAVGGVGGWVGWDGGGVGDGGGGGGDGGGGGGGGGGRGLREYFMDSVWE